MLLQDLDGLFSGLDNSTEEGAPDTSVEFTCREDDPGMGAIHAVFQPVVYSLVLLLGVTGNGLMLTVLLRRCRLLRITEIYLLHLALADLLLLATFPLALAQLSVGWVFGELLCKLMGLLNRLNLLCGSLLLACIGFDRYLAIVHAIPSMQSRHPRTVHLTCLLLWLLCLALSAPNALFLTVKSHPADPSRLSCFFYHYGIHSHNWLLTNRFLTHVLCFVLPLAVMTYCYSAVVATLCRIQRSQQKRSAVRLALLVTAVFCLCWLPYNLAMLVDTMVTLGLTADRGCTASTRLKRALAVTESLGFSHSCLNPFLYAFVGVHFRRELLEMFSRWGCRRCCQPLLGACGPARSSVSTAGTTCSSVHIWTSTPPNGTQRFSR